MGSLELPLIKDSKQPASKQMKSSPRLLAARKVHFQTTVRHCYTVTLAPSAQTWKSVKTPVFVTVWGNSCWRVNWNQCCREHEHCLLNWGRLTPHQQFPPRLLTQSSADPFGSPWPPRQVTTRRVSVRMWAVRARRWVMEVKHALQSEVLLQEKECKLSIFVFWGQFQWRWRWGVSPTPPSNSTQFWHYLPGDSIRFHN